MLKIKIKKQEWFSIQLKHFVYGIWNSANSGFNSISDGIWNGYLNPGGGPQGPPLCFQWRSALRPIIFYTVGDRFINTQNPIIELPSIKTLDLRVQNSFDQRVVNGDFLPKITCKYNWISEQQYSNILFLFYNSKILKLGVNIVSFNFRTLIFSKRC